ncbi:hypothetical protein SUGI_0364500 [Cryptomeria japonica]|nr:hypothetical protein SUGI_0364500 [Cryptomeria japonica]
MEERRRTLGFPGGGAARLRGWDQDFAQRVYRRPWYLNFLKWTKQQSEERIKKKLQRPLKDSSLGGILATTENRLGNHFEIKTLTNGFFLIIAGSVEEKTALMESGSFLMSGVGFYIRDWTPNFDPRQANLEEIPMWIRLYNLPHEYWKEEIFKSVGEKIGRFIKSNEAVDKLSSCMYARIYVMWKTHLGLPKVVEMRSPKGVWRQDIEIEEIIVKCKICKEWGHEDRDCLSGQKGKGKADRALEEKLLVGAVADQSLGNINPSFVTEAASDEVIRLCSDRQVGVVEFSHGQGLSLGEEKEDQVCKGSGWEGDSQIEGKRLEVGVGLDEKVSEIGGGYPSQHRFYNTSADGLKYQEMGDSAKSLVVVEDLSANAKGNTI